MIEPITNKLGVPRVTVRCDADGCAREETVTCDYERTAKGDWNPDEGQAHRKMVGKGWTLRKGLLLCPACEAKRKIERTKDREMKAQAQPTSNVAPIREPTREQKRQIMDLLGVSYDTDAGRYKGSDTDVTVAEAIGGGVMPGWVSSLREDFFGPDGGNGEMDGLLDEMRAWVADRKREAHNARIHLENAEGVLRTLDERIQQVDGFAKRVEAIKRAVGPKAAGA